MHAGHATAVRYATGFRVQTQGRETDMTKSMTEGWPKALICISLKNKIKMLLSFKSVQKNIGYSWFVTL